MRAKTMRLWRAARSQPRPGGLTGRLLGLPPVQAHPEPPAGGGSIPRGWGGWWARHPRMLHALVAFSFCWSAAYVGWRLGWSWHGADALLWSVLLVCELYGLLSFVMLAWLTWEVRASVRPRTLPGRTVDVYICTYDEPPALLEATLAGCALMAYPHTTWLLDDGARPEMAALAEAWGARYMTRPDKSHAKAGNINHALPLTDGELVLVLDADHVPLPDALETLVGYFEDPHTALVQTPHDFSNHDSVQHYDLGRHEQSVFFATICVGKDRHNAAFWCGSGALMRREALLGVGGVATETIAEDFHTTIKLHRQGWRTHFDERVVVQGRAPHDLAAYLLQRDRWARGNLSVFTTPESPLRARELTPQQRLSYFASLIAYLAGPVRVMMMLTLTAVLWSGALPLRIAPMALLALWAPATLLMVLAGSALSRGQQGSSETIHYELCTAEIFMRALRCIVRPGRTTFRVTPKEGVDPGGWEAIRQFRLLLVCGVLLTLGLTWRIADNLGFGLVAPMHGFASWFVPLLGLIELRRVARTLALVGRHRQLRVEYRTPVSAAAAIVPSDGRRDGGQPALLGRMHDITTGGVGFELACPLQPGTRANLTVQLPGIDHGTDGIGAGGIAPINLEVLVRACMQRGAGWRIGAEIANCGESDRRRVLEYCNVIWPYQRLRGHDTDVPASISTGLSRPRTYLQPAPEQQPVSQLA